MASFRPSPPPFLWLKEEQYSNNKNQTIRIGYTSELSSNNRISYYTTSVYLASSIEDNEDSFILNACTLCRFN